MTEISAREGDRCMECGTPLEAIEPSDMPQTEPGEIVLRCANGHELRVTRHEPGAAGESDADNAR